VHVKNIVKRNITGAVQIYGDKVPHGLIAAVAGKDLLRQSEAASAANVSQANVSFYQSKYWDVSSKIWKSVNEV